MTQTSTALNARKISTIARKASHVYVTAQSRDGVVEVRLERYNAARKDLDAQRIALIDAALTEAGFTTEVRGLGIVVTA